MTKAQDYSGGMYPELNELIDEARVKGVSRVLVRVNNQTHIKLDPVFEQDLLEIDQALFVQIRGQFHRTACRHHRSFQSVQTAAIFDISDQRIFHLLECIEYRLLIAEQGLSDACILGFDLTADATAAAATPSRWLSLDGSENVRPLPGASVGTRSP